VQDEEMQVIQNTTHPLNHSLGMVLAAILERGVKFKIEKGRLRYQAPKGALAEQEIAWMRDSRSELLEALGRIGEDATTTDLDCETFELAPLTFSQLAHWRNFRLFQRPSIRQIASATRIIGPLSIDALNESIAAVVCRHDALRTRVVMIDGVPVQRVDRTAAVALQLCNVPSNSRAVALAIQEAIDTLILEPVDVSIGPMWKLRLLQLKPNEHILIIAIEHMISDATSLAILTTDIFFEYARATLTRADLLLPQVSMQLADYALRQRQTAAWGEKHSSHWKRLSQYGRARFPSERESRQTYGWSSVPVRIDSKLKERLQTWSRSWGVTLAMAVFTAYVALVLRWCGIARMVVGYVTDGRSDQKLENAVGFYASVLYLRISLSESDSFVDLVSQLVKEYCVAHEHDDQFYLIAQPDRPAFTKNTCFNWVPLGTRNALSTSIAAEFPLECVQISFPHPIVQRLDSDEEPFLVVEEHDSEIIGDFYFPKELFPQETMSAFVKCFEATVDTMLSSSDRPMSECLELHTER
jgi:hypothetical protein